MSSPPFWHIHAHTHFSAMDAMSTTERMVDKVVKMGQPALATTDHGNMGATVRLYKACKKAGILPYPGFEGYLIDPAHDGEDEHDSKAKRYHFGLLARNLAGYKAMVRFNSLAHTRPRFNRFPRHTMADLTDFGSEHGDNVILTTGCYFGLAQQRLVNQGEAAAERVVREYASWFPHTVVELQHHNTKHDDSYWTDSAIVNTLVGIADRVGLPAMAGQDAHYLNQADKPAHNLLKKMYHIDEFPGDSYHLASTEWVRDHYTAKVWDRVEESAQHLLDLHELAIPPLDTYQARLPRLTQHPQLTLALAVWKALRLYAAETKLSPAELAAYEARLTEELDVIRFTNQATYFLLARREVVEWCERRGIFIESRGSANGSLVTFLLGITQVDPIIWGTLFERFMSRDRLKPPDIDFDIEDSRRGELVAHLGTRFPTIHIGTWAALGSRADNPERGSALVSYMMYLRRQCEEMADTIVLEQGLKKGAKAELARRLYEKYYGHVKGYEDIKAIDPDDARALGQIIGMDSVRKSYGVHAGGILLPGSDLDVHDYVPSMLVASSNTKVTQFDMDDVEELGWQKLDLLGQASLTVLKICQQLLGRKKPNDFRWIPLTTKGQTPEEKQRMLAAFKILREGRVGNGIFHMEGYTKAKGGRQMGVNSVRDTILAMALFMPGAMDSGQTDHYLRARKDPMVRAGIRYYSPIFEKVLRPTHNAVIYQEQPLQILRDYGMDIKSINVLFKVLKDSGKGAHERNAARIASLRAEFLGLAGADLGKQFDAAWQQITGFVAYGFNKAHATGYGIRAYRFAYLSANYPLEFFTALLTVAAGKKDDERRYASEARRRGLRILPASVNKSGASYTIDPQRRGIRRGLLAIAGVGPAAAANIQSQAPFASVTDLVSRCDSRAVTGGAQFLKTGDYTGTLLKLKDADALSDLGVDAL